MERAVRILTTVGVLLPAVALLAVALTDLSAYFARLDVLGSVMDCSMLLSVPWELVATVFVVLRWRDLPQRFWIVYCINAFLAYKTLPLYLFHFGIYW